MWLIATANAVVVVDFLKPLFTVWFDFDPKTDLIRTAYTPAISVHILANIQVKYSQWSSGDTESFFCILLWFISKYVDIDMLHKTEPSRCKILL